MRGEQVGVREWETVIYGLMEEVEYLLVDSVVERKIVVGNFFNYDVCQGDVLNIGVVLFVKNFLRNLF